MQSALLSVSVAMLLSVTPILSSAQTPSHPTHAEVRQQLVNLEERGYWPSNAKDIHYPDDIQAAEARLDAAKAVHSNGLPAKPGTGVETRE